MPAVFAILATPVAKFAEGVILAASVYLASRGKRNPLNDRT